MFFPYYRVHLYSCWVSTPPTQQYHPLRVSVTPDCPLTEQFPGRLPSHGMFEQVTDILVTMFFLIIVPQTPSASLMFVHARVYNFFLFFSTGQHFSFLKDAFLLLQSHLPCWLLLTLSRISLDAQLLSLHFPCDLQKQYPHSLQRVRCSICLVFSVPADLCLAFLFEAEQSNGRELWLTLPLQGCQIKAN